VLVSGSYIPGRYLIISLQLEDVDSKLTGNLPLRWMGNPYSN
jgi:hypothetical protein